jgi:hypothetical protein
MKASVESMEQIVHMDGNLSANSELVETRIATLLHFCIESICRSMRLSGCLLAFVKFQRHPIGAIKFSSCARMPRYP